MLQYEVTREYAKSSFDVAVAASSLKICSRNSGGNPSKLNDIPASYVVASRVVETKDGRTIPGETGNFRPKINRILSAKKKSSFPSQSPVAYPPFATSYHNTTAGCRPVHQNPGSEQEPNPNPSSHPLQSPQQPQQLPLPLFLNDRQR